MSMVFSFGVSLNTEGFMSPKKSNHNFKTEQTKTTTGSNVLKYIGLAIVSLALLGLIFSSVFSGRTKGGNHFIFGSYGGRNIEYTYDNAFGQAVEKAMANYNTGVDQDNQFYTFIRYMAWQEAYTSVVFNTAIAYHLDKSGYEPSSRAVDRQIIEFGRYRTNGEFDEAKYIAATQTTKDADRKMMREQLTLATWGQDVLDSQYHSQAQLDFLWEMRSTENSYDYISIPFSDFPEKKILEYGEKNLKLFTKRPVSRITASDEEKAKEVVSKFEEKRQDMTAFSEIAAEYSQDSYKDDGGSMGATDYYLISDLIGAENTDAVFALGEGDIAGPFETDYGWIVFKADGPSEAVNVSDRVEDIRSYMLQNEVGILEDAMIAKAEELRVKAIAAGSFREAMTQNGFQVQTTAAFPVNFATDSMLGGSPENSDDPVLNGTASSEDFWSKIVPITNIGDVSRPVVLNSSVALFSLAASNTAEKMDYWPSLVDYEVARSRQTDFQTAVVNPDSKLFDDKFSEEYNRIFPAQG
ncbi:MAG: hypothetical protein DRP49_05355 [Spirochaetes bacterium]|nr:MAG: hypothetical protein DRP49_05355 [Spirochaetota bacterium]